VTALGALIHQVEPQGLLSLSDQLMLISSHHHSLFLDRTVTDALGGEGWAVCRQAAFDSTHALLRSVVFELGIHGPKERLDLAAELFQAMGHGQLVFNVTAEGGEVGGRDLHHGASFSDKYGARLRNRKAVDAYAAGFSAAAASLAYPSDWGLFESEEIECVARGDAQCTFTALRRPERHRPGEVVRRSDIERFQVPPRPAPPSDEAISSARTTRDLLNGLSASERGRLDAFGMRIAVVPVGYFGQITFDTMHLVEARTPELFQVYAALVREAAQLGAFLLLGGVVRSEGWQKVCGAPSADVAVRLDQLLGVARSLGWGAIWVEHHEPQQKLVLRCAVTHESLYYAVRHGNTMRARLPFLQGVALGIMMLVSAVDVALLRDPAARFDEELYERIFRDGRRFVADETQSSLRGDGACEITVETLSS
jgi:hypothetical protein